MHLIICSIFFYLLSEDYKDFLFSPQHCSWYWQLNASLVFVCVSYKLFTDKMGIHWRNR